MMTRLIAIFAILHGTVFLGAGNALEHLVHQMEAGESGHHAHHHQHHLQEEKHMSSGTMTDEDWMNCVFCLDGVMGTDISVAWLDIQHPAVALLGVTHSPGFSSIPSAGFHARAPPRIS